VLYGNEDFSVEVIVSDPLPVQERTFLHLCLEVGDRDRFIERCREMGLEIKLIPRGEALLCFIKDFDGNLYEIKE
jgi:catechol 2,3-dioxygenase-like lactoylglutathione lyase family enzyme